VESDGTVSRLIEPPSVHDRDSGADQARQRHDVIELIESSMHQREAARIPVQERQREHREQQHHGRSDSSSDVVHVVCPLRPS
jgi:hypothetical protein